MKRWRRPEWVSRDLSFYLVIQLLFAVALLLVLVLGSNPRRHVGLELQIGMATVALVLVISLVGIWKDRWWAYFLQLAIFIGAAIAVGTLPSTAKPKPHHLGFVEVPYFHQITGWVEVVCFIALCWELWKRGVLRWNQRRRISPQTDGRSA